MYITNIPDTAMVVPNTANTTNGIAPNPPFVALRRPLPPLSSVSGLYPEADGFSPICLRNGTEAKLNSENAVRSIFEEHHVHALG